MNHRIPVGQIWINISGGKRVVIRKGSSKRKVTFTYLEGKKGHNMEIKGFLKSFEYTGECLIGKQLRKPNDT